jgi:hypothetical protein
MKSANSSPKNSEKLSEARKDVLIADIKRVLEEEEARKSQVIR